MAEWLLMPADHLTPQERTQLGALTTALDCGQVRLYRGQTGGVLGPLRRLVLWASRNRAVALGNHVFLPDRCHADLAVLAHELTHCGQYQAWGAWTYFMRGASAQVRDLLHRGLCLGRSPYRYTVEPGKPFESYGMEQQAQMVEDWFRQSRGLTPFRQPDLPNDALPYPEACPPTAPARFHPDPPPWP